jgi:Leucine-rich repeat (LRR) protein
MNLTLIPPEFFSSINFRNVRVLSLAENAMTDLPQELFSMAWITQLKLMHNKLSKIPEDIGKLKELRILWIQHNMLCSLPESLIRCINLSALDFSSNKDISYVPLCYAQMTNLTLLNANECAINTPPPSIMAKSIKKIQEYLQRLLFAQSSDTFRHTDIPIITIPELFFDWLPNITALDLSHCGLRSIQDAFFPSFCLLMSLDLSQNLISEISPKISLLTHLTNLDISSNLITFLPSNIGFLPLQTFNYLQKGMISDPIGPSEFDPKSKNSKQYTVSEWRAKRSISQQQNAHDSSIYDLYGDLTRAPLSVFLCFLRELELCKTSGTIDFGCMFLQRVPEALLHQDEVQNLILRQNQLIMIPHAIGNLMPLLKKLDIAENALCELPDSLSSLQNIEYMDISKNCFNSLGLWLSACTSLTHLNIEDNNIDSIPKSYRALQSMKVFKAQNNKLSRLPRFIGGWPHIAAISVWNPILIDPPPEISTTTDSEMHIVDCARYMRVVFLSKHAGFARLSGFNLLGIPNRFSSSSEILKVLDLSENRIRSFPVWISTLTCLETLNVSFNLISELPDSIQLLTSLCSLNLNSNPIEWLPSCLVAITILREVSVLNCNLLCCPSAFVCSQGWLAENGIRSYLSQLWECKDSLEVDLSGYGLLEIDLSPYSLTCVTELHIDDNQIQSLPNTMANMFSLSRLHASNNLFQKWPLCNRMWQSIVLLNLSLNAIDSVPKDIQCMTSLERLMMAGNRLTFIAPHIGRCLRLTHVSLRDNPNLQTIPLEFGRCSSIQALSMSPSLKIPQYCVCSTRGGALFQPYMCSALVARSTQSLHLMSLDIESIPHELFSYSYSEHIFFHDALNEGTLVHMNLSYNKIVTIPVEISLFHSLKVLNLGHNQIAKISPEIQVLSQLSDFNVQNNCLQAFSSDMFKNWTQLTSLNFSSNSLSRFPAFLFTCSALQVFVTFGNPWIFPNVTLGNRLGNNIVALIFATQVEKILQAQIQDQIRLESAEILFRNDALKFEFHSRSNRPASAPHSASHSNEPVESAPLTKDRPISSDSKDRHSERLRQKEVQIDGENSFSIEKQHQKILQKFDPATPDLKPSRSTANELNLIGYGVEDFPPELCLLTSLEVLNLRNNVLTEIPNKFTHLSRLKYINFSHNRFKTFPSIFVHLQLLAGLDLSSNFLPEWPSEILKLSHLISLNLSHNFIRRIPDRIALFTQLRTFLIHGNHLNYVPRTFYFLSSITALNLSCNPELEVIPCEIGILRALRFFYIDKNPALFSPPMELHGVGGASNALASRYLFQLYKSRVCMKLDVSYFGLVDVPSCLFRPLVMLFLLEVDLSHNNICKLSQSLVLLARLQNLNLSSNLIVGLDMFLTSLTSLRSLDVSFNNVKYCGAVFMMWKLQDICLTGNFALTCLTCISEDDVCIECFCHQSGLPSSAWCTSLKELRCNDTSVSHLPRSLARSKDLFVLNFENCSLRSLHSDILQCQNLEILRWSGCPQMDPSLVLLLSQGIKCVQMLSRRLDTAFQNGALDLQGISLEDIPFISQEIDIWSDVLHEIKASGLPRQHLPNWLPNLRILSSIFVENCGLSKLSEEIFKCKMLRELFASRNYITSVYIDEPMTCLEILNISHNRISLLNLCKNAWPLLSVLTIHHNLLLTLPENLKDSVCLRHVDCSFCLIRHWPQSLHELQNAEFIDISHNSLHSFNLSHQNSDRTHKNPLFLSNLTSLNLSYNSFSEMPEWLENCYALCEFRATFCRCFVIPWKIGMQMNIRVMEFDQDKVSDPPAAFSQYGLHGIKLYCVKLQTSVKRRVLVFDNMAFTKGLPASVFSVHNLLKMSLKHCSFPRMPSDVANLSTLLSLTLNNCHLSESPSHIDQLSTLLLLDLGGNGELRDLDVGFSKLRRLQNLNISYCSFDKLPRCVLALSSLTILDVSHNSVSRIPSRIGRLTQLIRLHVAYNKISNIPPSIGCCSFLRVLDIDHNPIDWLPWQIGQLGALMRLSTSGLRLQPPLNQLVASGGLEKLLKFFYNALIGAESGSGDFARLQIASLSPAAALLGIGLKKLDLSANSIHQLPSECGLWTDLKQLDLSHNQIVSLHANFQKLIKLKYLRLNHNKLFTFPDAMFNLTNLKILNLSKNRIHSIPGTISCMYFLKELNLNDNAITEIPEDLRFCTSLSQLMLVRNHIQVIPSSLSVMKNLLIEFFDGLQYSLPLSQGVQHSLQQKFMDAEIVATFDIYVQTISHASIPANKIPLKETLMAEMYFVTLFPSSEQTFTSGRYYFSSSIQIHENIASIKVSSVIFEQFLLNGLTLMIQIWIKTKSDLKMICVRDIKLLPSMCSGVPFMLNMNETMSINEPGSFMTTFAIVTQGMDSSSNVFNTQSDEDVSQQIEDSLNLLLPEMSSLDLSEIQVSHLTETDVETYDNERSIVKRSLLSSLANKRLQLNGTVVWTLPENLCSGTIFRSLESIEMCFCPITSLPSAVSHLVNLKIMNFSSNQLNHLSCDAFPILNLEFLELQKNCISELPESLGLCCKLKSVDVSSNMLQNLPLGFGKCSFLESLNFVDNPMSCLPNAVFSHSIADLQTFLNALSLQFSKCIVSFQDFGLSTLLLTSDLNWESIRELNLSKNVIASVSKSICSRLDHLQIIDLSDNPIVIFPAFWHCRSIRRILLHHTQICDVPSQVSQLHSLECLDLSWCRLSEIVQHISEIPVLKEIHLSGNTFEGCVTLNLPVSCTLVDIHGASLSSLKFQSEAKRLRQDSAKQDLVKRFGKTLLRKTQESTRVIQGHIYRDEHLSDIELNRVNEAKVENLRTKLGLIVHKDSATLISTPQASTPITTPKRNDFASIRSIPMFIRRIFCLSFTFIYRIDDALSSKINTIKIMNLAHNNFQIFASSVAHHHPIEELDM